MKRQSDYADPQEVEEYKKERYPLTKCGRLWVDEIERRFAEGDSVEFIARSLGIKPWQIQLLIAQATLENYGKPY